MPIRRLRLGNPHTQQPETRPPATQRSIASNNLTAALTDDRQLNRRQGHNLANRRHHKILLMAPESDRRSEEHQFQFASASREQIADFANASPTHIGGSDHIMRIKQSAQCVIQIFVEQNPGSRCGALSLFPRKLDQPSNLFRRERRNRFAKAPRKSRPARSSRQ